MSRRQSDSSGLIKLWILAGIGGAAWVWLSTMDGTCTYSADNPSCLGQIFGHSFTPLVGWIAFFLAGLAVIATLATLLRRAFR